jgi:hypothetical protein
MQLAYVMAAPLGVERRGYDERFKEAYHVMACTTSVKNGPNHTILLDCHNIAYASTLYLSFQVSTRDTLNSSEDVSCAVAAAIQYCLYTVDFATTVESNDNCQQCSKRIQSRSFDSSRAIKCSMCYFAFHNKCLVPLISEQLCRTPSFFACCSECIAECERKQ